MREILRQKAEAFVDKLGPSLGRSDFTCTPVYPEKRWDICVVRRTARDGYSYGFDTIYLLWLGGDNGLLSRKLLDSSSTGDYLDVEEISEKKHDIVVRVAGSRYGTKWSREFVIPKADLGLE